MICAKCGIDLPDHLRICRGCGQTLGVVSVGRGVAAAVAPARIPAPEAKSGNAKSGNAMMRAVGLLLLLAFLPIAPKEEP